MSGWLCYAGADLQRPSCHPPSSRCCSLLPKRTNAVLVSARPVDLYYCPSSWCCKELHDAPAGAAQRAAQALLVVALHEQTAATTLNQLLRSAQHHLCTRGQGRKRHALDARQRTMFFALHCVALARPASPHGLQNCSLWPVFRGSSAVLTRKGGAEALQRGHGREELALELLRPPNSQALRGAGAGHGHPAQKRKCGGQTEGQGCWLAGEDPMQPSSSPASRLTARAQPRGPHG